MTRFISVLVVVLSVSVHQVIASKYILGQLGDSCTQACFKQDMNCNPAIRTSNSIAQFEALGVKCTANPAPWGAISQPGYVSDPRDPSHGQCLGWMDVADGVVCSGSHPSIQRLCRCDLPSHTPTFGTGISTGGTVGPNETDIFAWVLASGDTAHMTQFWVTSTEDTTDMIVRYYIDGETTPSIEFSPNYAVTEGDDNTVPWGTSWFGKNADRGGVYFNFKIPFQKSVRVSTQRPSGSAKYWVNVRGEANLPIIIQNLAIPSTARLTQFTVDKTAEALEFVTMANVTHGSGFLFAHTFQIASQSQNTIEGCFHGLRGGEDFPGLLLGTGVEDYFLSAWGFEAGTFREPSAGLTYIQRDRTANTLALSAYRVHDMDPIRFQDGFVFLWRNGDSFDASGHKCYTTSTNHPVGNPNSTAVKAYSWVYVW